MTASIGAILGVIGLLVYSVVYNALNTAAIGTDATSLLTIVPILLAAVIILSIVSIFRSD